MSLSVISKYLAWQRNVCNRLAAAVGSSTFESTKASELPSEGVSRPVMPSRSTATSPSGEGSHEAYPAADQASAKVAVPEVKAPEVKAPEVKAPEVKAPEVEAPKDKAPEDKAPEVKAPEAKASENKAPEVKAPEAKAPENKVSVVAEASSDEASSSESEAPAEVKSVGSWSVPVFERESADDVLFQDFALDTRIMRALLEDLGFKKCSPIQGLALPPALEGKDIAGKAQTGTGKTATFLIAMLQKFLTSGGGQRKDNQPFALVLAPTRELAIQIGHDANELCAYCHFKTVPVYGGMDYDRQRRLLMSHVDMVVATPGRLIDYLKHGVVDLDAVQTLIIDEADRMLDMGFIPDVKRIIGRLKGPETRQTMLFSATLNRDIMNLASRWMRPNPVKIEVEPEHMLAEGIQETIYTLTAAEKLPVLLWTLNHEDCHRVLIFRNRRDDVEELHAELQRFGVASEMLSGDVDQKKRLRILEDFRAGRIKVIVATDVAGRGIHVDDVTHVVNYDFPYEAEDYVHRVGRTARAGHTGRAISFADENSSFVIPDIEEYIGRPLKSTFPTDEMLTLPEAYKNVRPHVEKTHSMRSHGGGHGSYNGSRVRRGGPRR